MALQDTTQGWYSDSTRKAATSSHSTRNIQGRYSFMKYSQKKEKKKKKYIKTYTLNPQL